MSSVLLLLNMQTTKTIKASEACFFIRSRAHFAEAMQKAGYCLPAKHSAMCTLHFMYGIRFKTYYCPKLVDKNLLKMCHHPPTKEILLEKLN